MVNAIKLDTDKLKLPANRRLVVFYLENGGN